LCSSRESGAGGPPYFGPLPEKVMQDEYPDSAGAGQPELCSTEVFSTPTDDELQLPDYGLMLRSSSSSVVGDWANTDDELQLPEDGHWPNTDNELQLPEDGHCPNTDDELQLPEDTAPNVYRVVMVPVLVAGSSSQLLPPAAMTSAAVREADGLKCMQNRLGRCGVHTKPKGGVPAEATQRNSMVEPLECTSSGWCHFAGIFSAAKGKGKDLATGLQWTHQEIYHSETAVPDMPCQSGCDMPLPARVDGTASTVPFCDMKGKHPDLTEVHGPCIPCTYARVGKCRSGDNCEWCHDLIHVLRRKAKKHARKKNNKTQ